MSESGIFKVAVKLPPDRRAAYLDQACGCDAELRDEIESLLHAHDTSVGFLENVPEGPDPTDDYQPIAERPARSLVLINSWSRSAKEAWAWSSSPNSSVRSAVRSRSRSSSPGWTAAR